MGNPMYLARTRFETLDQSGTVVSTSYGARVYDDIGCTYSNFIESTEELIALDADDLVERMRQDNETANEMIETVFDLGDTFYVDDALYAGGRREGRVDEGYRNEDCRESARRDGGSS